MAIPSAKIGGVADEATSQDKFAQGVNRRYCMARRERDKLIAVANEENVEADQ